MKEFEADTNLRCCLVVDTSGSMAFGSDGVTKIDYAKRIAGTLGYLAVQQGDAVGLAVRGRRRRHAKFRRGATRPIWCRSSICWNASKPPGETQLVPLLHELAETIRQRALVIIISDLFADPAESAQCFEHLRFRKHDLAAFHLLDPLELGFTFHRPMRFLDMEGGPAIFAEPNDIADRYHKALARYLARRRTRSSLETAVDYHRVRIDDDYEQVLLDFLIGRTRARGACDELPPAVAAGRPAARRAADHHPPDQPAAIPDDRLGRDAVPAGSEPHVARLRPDPPVADPAVPRAGDRGPGLRDQPAAGQRLAGPRRRRPAGHDARFCSTARPACSSSAAGTCRSKLETGVRSCGQTLDDAWFDRVGCSSTASRRSRARSKSPAELLESPAAQPASASADLPAMLQAAHDYIKNNRTGQTEIWICSDLRANDWNAESGRWKGLRDSFQEFKQSVRFHLLAYSAPAADNLSVRVTDVERRTIGDEAALFLSLQLTRDGDTGKRSIPIHFDIEGARSELTVDMEGRELDLKNHRIPLAADRVSGWGRVSIPADENPADNEFYFVFDELPPRRTILVTEDAAATRPLELAAGSSPDPAASTSIDVIGPDQLAGVAWEDVALVLWQARLPESAAADPIEQFVNRGGQVVFFPPGAPGNETVFGARWTKWESPPEPVHVESWRGDQDLLARTQSGAALPVGELTVRRYCGLEGELTTLAKLYGGATLLGRVTTDRGGVYFCASTASPADTSLGTEGVSLYVAIQRALAAGAAELSKARQLAAGNSFPHSVTSWQKLAGSDDTLSTEYPFHAGVYAADKQMLAVNRSAEEDRTTILSDTRVAELFRGLDFDLVNDQAGNMRSLARGLAIVHRRHGNRDGGRSRFVSTQKITAGRRGELNSVQSLTFLASPWTVAAAILVWLVVAGLSFIAWRRSGYRPSIGALEALRLLILAIVGVLLNQPEWIEEFRPEEKPSIAVLHDASASMTTLDVVNAETPTSSPTTRADAIAPLKQSESWQPLGERFNIAVQAIAEPSAGSGTDLGTPLTAALEKIASLRGIVLASDGDWNDGDPPVEAAFALRMAGVPVFAVPVGSTQRLPDVELLSLDAPTFGVAGKVVRIPFTVESTLPRSRTATVKLRASNGDEVTKEIQIAPQGRTTDWLAWKPKETGDFNLTLEVPKQVGELIPDNNRLTAPISIREEKLRVLVVESTPRWEYRYLRNALSRDPGVELSCLLFHPGLDKIGGGNKDYIKEFPGTLEALAKFDVVFLGDVGVEENQLTVEQCRLLRGLVEFQASGLVFLPGMYGRQSSLVETPLTDLYPVLLDDTQPGGWGSRTPSRFQLTETGERSLLTKLADSQQNNADVWEELPGFQWYAPVVRAKAGCEVLCVHSDASNDFGRLPLVVTRTFRRRQGALHGHRWRMAVAQRRRGQISLSFLGPGRALDGLSAQHGQRRNHSPLLFARSAAAWQIGRAQSERDGTERRAAFQGRRCGPNRQRRPAGHKPFSSPHWATSGALSWANMCPRSRAGTR